MKTRDIVEGVGKITSQNATKDVPVGGEYMNIKKLFPNQKKPMKLGEGYKLNLERDKKADMYILHIQDTKTGNRTEVRGKTGYEGKGYDPADKLHKLLDKIGRSANVSELINGEVVTINPKHPQAPSASAATDTAFNEDNNPKTPKWKRTGPDGEIEIEFPTGRRFKIEKQYDENIRHRGEWKVLEWDTRSEDWEWGDTYSPKGYAKEMVMKMGQYDSNGKQVADYSHTFQFEAINESLDNPYPYKWDKQDEDHWVAKADTPAGLMLVMFEWEEGDSSWNIDFAVNGRMGKSGEGDEFRIFATAVAVIKEWITKVDLSSTKIISFSADKGPEVGNSRAKLYSRFAKQMASQLGWKLDVVNVDHSKADYFKIHNPNVQENFADGKVKGKSKPGRVKAAGASCDGSVTELRKKAKNSSGEKQKMYHWCANMKSGKKK